MIVVLLCLRVGVLSFCLPYIDISEQIISQDCLSRSNTPFILPKPQSLSNRVGIHLICFAVTMLWFASLHAFTLSFCSPHFDGCGVKSGARKGVRIIASPCALFGAPFHIDNHTIANCSFQLEYTCKTPLEVVAETSNIECGFSDSGVKSSAFRAFTSNQPHYSQNAFASALLARYERGIRNQQQTSLTVQNSVYKLLILALILNCLTGELEVVNYKYHSIHSIWKIS